MKKILLDEQLHQDLQTLIIVPNFTIFTLEELGWKGLKNGVLREKLNENEFNFLLTADKNLPFQQNFQKMNFSIILIDTPSTRWRHQAIFIEPLINLLSNLPDILPKMIWITSSEWLKINKLETVQTILQPEDLLMIYL